MTPEKDQRYLQEKYAHLLENGTGSLDSSESPTEKNNRPKQNHTQKDTHIYYDRREWSVKNIICGIVYCYFFGYIFL